MDGEWSDSESGLTGQLDEGAREMMDSLRASDRVINSAATRIRYDPGFQGSPTLMSAASRRKEAMEKASLGTDVKVTSAGGQNDVDENSSTDSFLQALKSEDDGELLRRWQARNQEAVATFKDLLSELMLCIAFRDKV
jgi:hypothetical protein